MRRAASWRGRCRDVEGKRPAVRACHRGRRVWQRPLKVQSQAKRGVVRGGKGENEGSESPAGAAGNCLERINPSISGGQHEIALFALCSE